MDRTFVLRERNKQIKLAITRINDILDVELFVSDLLKDEQKYLAILEQHEQEEARLEKAMIKQRDIYVKRSSDLKGTFTTKSRNLKGLYMRLRRQYEFEAKMNRAPVRPIDAWEIPVDHSPPVASLPKAVPDFKTANESVMRQFRQSVRHYRFRAHWSTKSACSHLEKLSEIEREKAKVHPQLMNKKSQLLANIERVIRTINDIRDRLVNNPPNHIWVDTFNAYAFMVKDHFKAMQANEIKAEQHKMGTLAITNPVLSYQTAPVRSTMRRMDGEDINDIGNLFTATKSNRQTLMQAIQTSGLTSGLASSGSQTCNRTSQYGTNPLLRMSKSMMNLDGKLQKQWMSAEIDTMDCGDEREVYSMKTRQSMTEDLVSSQDFCEYPIEYIGEGDSSSVYDENERNADSPLTPDTPEEECHMNNGKRLPQVSSQQSMASVITRASR